MDSLQMIVAYSVARYVNKKSDVEALEIPETVGHLRSLVEGFVDNDNN